jgi:hypothetical protein
MYCSPAQPKWPPQEYGVWGCGVPALPPATCRSRGWSEVFDIAGASTNSSPPSPRRGNGRKPAGTKQPTGTTPSTCRAQPGGRLHPCAALFNHDRPFSLACYDLVVQNWAPMAGRADPQRWSNRMRPHFTNTHPHDAREIDARRLTFPQSSVADSGRFRSSGWPLVPVCWQRRMNTPTPREVREILATPEWIALLLLPTSAWIPTRNSNAAVSCCACSNYLQNISLFAGEGQGRWLARA